MKKNSLWVKVLQSKYGMREGGFLSFLGRECGIWSGWWKDIVKHTIGEKGEWFMGRLERVISDVHFFRSGKTYGWVGNR
ncbi:hypothetical protein ACS0TY_024863 [Phlomoides rotata]